MFQVACDENTVDNFKKSSWGKRMLLLNASRPHVRYVDSIDNISIHVDTLIIYVPQQTYENVVCYKKYYEPHNVLSFLIFFLSYN